MRVRSAFIVVFVATLLAGCSSKLDRDEAQKKVEAYDRFRESLDVSVTPNTQEPFTGAPATALRDLGLAQGATRYGTTVLVLTDAGKRAANTWNARGSDPWRTYAIPVARRKIESVRVANLSDSTAEAEVEWRWDLNEVGRACRKAQYNTAFNNTDFEETRRTIFAFKKYDDGWRPTAYRRASDGLDVLN